MSKKKLEILLIEADEAEYLAIRELVHNIPGDKYRLAWVSSFEEGQSVIESNVFDAYLMNYQMGQEDGIKLLGKVSGKPIGGPVILLTGKNDLDLDLRAMETGVADFLVKDNLTSDLLDRTIRYAIRQKNMIRALQRKERQLSDAQALANIGHWEWNLETDRIEWSEQHYRIFDMEPSEKTVTYEEFIERVHPDDRERLNGEWRALIKDRDYLEVEYRALLQDGTCKEIFALIRTERDREGKALTIRGTSQDITDRKRNEEALMINREALDQSTQPVAFADLYGQLTYVNQAFLHLWGYERKEELLGQSNSILAKDPEEMERIMQILRDEGHCAGESEAVKKNGDLLQLYFDASLVKNVRGEPILTRVSMIDLTQLKSHERELEREKAIAQQYLDMAGSMIVVIDQNETVSLINQVGCKILGCPEEEILGKNWFDQFIPESKRSTVRSVFRELMEADSPNVEHFENEIVDRNGVKRLISWYNRTLKDKNGRMVGTISSGVDITEQRRNEEQIRKYSDGLEKKVAERTQQLRESEQNLKKALEKEKELNVLKSRFVSMASHEFRTPLTSVLASADLIDMHLQRGNTDKYIKYVNRIKSSVKNLNSILNDFLSLEKLESGKVHFNPEPTDLGNFAREVLEEVNLITAKNQVVNLCQNGEKEALLDRHLVRNVLMNLLSNAIKYSPEGEDVDLSLKNDQKKLIIEVKDRGIGIPEEEHEMMFSRFFRANNVNNIKGTGLGLTIVKRYLEIMNGDIHFKSKVGEGTTFVVEIPQA